MISHICVDPSFENIQDALLNKFPTITKSAQLFERLSALAMLDAHAGPPSDNTDNTNANWGHYQFTGGLMTIKSVLVSWSALAETYLNILVDHLWELVKDLEIPAPSSGSVLAAPSPEADHAKRLQVLQINNLVNWISKKGISMVSNKRNPKKAKLIAIIVQSSSILDDNYIANIINTGS
ncbi:hypothetical protein EST38_g13630 [Candolleomyces aberdarensis]|uniref:Uncharacterized protein n=1 Tax=Candolleomyces aberdarensis TaxID=2316362 RepID=A0A4Q2D196_9AGAR|nr:hypothetical protein EST38_g13630 [Candolleomyces aberdarensis]